MKMSEYDWIVIKYDEIPNKIICERCGAEAISPTPCRITDAISMWDAFKDNHKKCKRKNE